MNRRAFFALLTALGLGRFLPKAEASRLTDVTLTLFAYEVAKGIIEIQDQKGWEPFVRITTKPTKQGERGMDFRAHTVATAKLGPQDLDSFRERYARPCAEVLAHHLHAKGVRDVAPLPGPHPTSGETEHMVVTSPRMALRAVRFFSLSTGDEAIQLDVLGRRKGKP